MTITPAKYLRTLCRNTPRSTIILMADAMQVCDWEREILLEYFCEPLPNTSAKTIDSLELTHRSQFGARVQKLKNKVLIYIASNADGILPPEFYVILGEALYGVDSQAKK